MNKQDIMNNLTIFPLKDYTKIPAVKWQQYNKPLREDVLSYAINCEKSNLVVIDLDVNNNKDGLESWIDLHDKFNKESTDTFAVETPNDGQHVYFTSNNPDIKSSVSKLGDGIDVRAKGGYVVGPESKYRKEDGTIVDYIIINDAKIAPLPKWLEKELLKLNIQEDEESNLIINDFPDEYARKALLNAYDRTIQAVEGERNNILNQETFGAAKAGAPADHIMDTMLRASEIIGLPHKEAYETIDKAIDAGSKLYVPRDNDVDQNELTRKMKEYWTNAELGDQFIRSQNYNLRKIIGSNVWLKYNKSHGIWEEYLREQVEYDITQFIKSEFNTLRNDKEKDKDVLYKAMTCNNANFFKGTYAYVSVNTLVHERELNKNKDKIVVKNGVVDLKTGKIKDFEREGFYVDRINVEYEQGYTNTIFDRILSCISKNDQEYVQLIAGQSLTGHQTATDKCFFLLGSGQNGKSSLVNLLSKTSGSYGGNPPQNTLLRDARGRNTNDLYAFKGLRQAIIEELPDAKYLDVGAIKRLVGTKNMTARQLYKDNETFEITSTLWITCNSLPGVSETDHGTWRRLIVIPFPYTYTTDVNKLKTGSKTYIKGDPSIKTAVDDDENVAKACLSWRIQGAMKWYQDKSLEENMSKNMKSIKENWQTSSDNIRLWMLENLNNTVGTYCLTQDLLDSYNKWLLENGFTKVSSKTFIKRFTEHELYYEWKLDYRMRSRIMAHTILSPYYNDYDKPREPGERASHIVGLAFKK